MELLYRWGDIIRGGGSCLELLYRQRDVEEAVRSSYNWGGISRGLFKAIILAEGYNKGWEGSGEAYLELLHRRRDLERAVWSIYISGGIL